MFQINPYMFDVYDPSFKGNEAAEQLDVAVRARGADTWCGLASLRRTVSETRYRHDTLRASHTGADGLAGETVCCARVSPHDQAEQLETQDARLETYRAEFILTGIKVVTDLNRRLDFHKTCLQRLLVHQEFML